MIGNFKNKKDKDSKAKQNKEEKSKKLRKLTNFKLGFSWRLRSSFFLIIFIFIVASTLVYLDIQKIRQAQEIVQQETAFQRDLQQIKDLSFEKYIYVSDLIARKDAEDYTALVETSNELEQLLDEKEKILSAAVDSINFNALVRNIKEFDNKVLSEVINPWEEDDFRADKTVVHILKSSRLNIQMLVGKLLEDSQQDVQIVQAQASQAMIGSERRLLTSLLAAVIIGVLMAVLLTGSLRRPLVRLSKFSETIASGDLSLKELSVDTRDEIGILSASFNQMAASLREILHRVRGTADSLTESTQELFDFSEEVNEAGVQVSSTIEEISRGSEELAQQADEMVSGVQVTGEKAKFINSRAQEMRKKADETRSSAEEGRTAVNQTIVGVDAVKEVVEQSGDDLQSLADKSEEIARFIGTIGEIAEQTNLLALNAAIEAARAGDSGSGFAVVAQEVRKLAEESSQAAAEIGKVVHDIQNGFERAKKSYGASRETADKAQTSMEDTKKAFNDISTQISELVNDIVDVGEAIEEMEEKTSDIQEAVESVASVSQETAAGTEQVSAATQQQTDSLKEINAAAEKLRQEARNLKELLQGFTLEA